MKDLGAFLTAFLQGKTIYTPARRILNVLFSASITSYVFERTHGHYHWLDFQDYKAMLDFMIKGHFFIPFSLFIIVHYLTRWFAGLIFLLVVYLPTARMTREIVKHKVTRRSVRGITNQVMKASKSIAPIAITPELIGQMVDSMRASITQETFQEVTRGVNEQKGNAEASFILFFRAAVTITVYFATLPMFGWKLYTLTLIVLAVAMFLMIVGSVLLELTPVILKKMYEEAEAIIAAHQPKPAR